MRKIRLEIYGKLTEVKQSCLKGNVLADIQLIDVESSKPYLIYDYFNNMEGLLKELTENTGIQID